MKTTLLNWVGVLSLCMTVNSSAGLAERTLDLYWIDSEGGGSTLIVTPAGESILIDAGNPGGRDPKRIHKVAAEAAGLKKIDHLVITHFDIDHFGGAAELSALIPVGCVYDNGSAEQDPNNYLKNTRWPELIKPYRSFKAEQRTAINPGDEIKLKAGKDTPALRLRCVAARQKFVPASASASSNSICAEAARQPADTSDNANSIALLLEYGNFRFFDGADLTWNTELALVCPTNRLGQVDVFQVDHHGLDISNNPLLIRSLAPTVAVMANGPRKGTGPQTMAALRATPSIEAIYQLHRNVRPDKENTAEQYIANLEEACQANYVQLSVPASAQAYTVSIPARGHKKSFRTRAQ